MQEQSVVVRRAITAGSIEQGSEPLPHSASGDRSFTGMSGMWLVGVMNNITQTGSPKAERESSSLACHYTSLLAAPTPRSVCFLASMRINHQNGS